MCIYFDFLDNIEVKYKFSFRNDYLHLNLIEKARSTKKLCHFIHIIECCIPYLKETPTNEESMCKFCLNPHQMDRIIGFISLYSKQLIAMFVCYFNCSLNVANEFFGRFKISTFSRPGLVSQSLIVNLHSLLVFF